MTEWAAARNVRGLFGEEGNETAAAGESGVKIGQPLAAPGEAAGLTACRHPFDVLLDKYRVHFNARFLEATAAVFQACGSYGLCWRRF